MSGARKLTGRLFHTLDRWQRNYDLHNLSLSAEHISGTGRRIEGENGQDSQTSHDREPLIPLKK